MITTDRNYADPERLRTAASRRPNQLRHEADGDGDADAQPCFDQPHHSINPRLGAMLEEDDAAQVSGELGRVGQTRRRQLNIAAATPTPRLRRRQDIKGTFSC